MKSALDFIRCLVVSLEFAAIVAILFIEFKFSVSELIPPFSLGNFNDLTKLVLVASPFSLFLYPFKDYKALLFPEADKQNLIVKWEKYYLIKNRFFATAFYNSISFLAYSVTAIFNIKPIGLICSSAILVSLISSVSFYLAKIKLEQIIRGLHQTEQ